MAKATLEISGWERALMAAEKVKERLRRATQALDAAGVRYAVAGDNAVAEWVGRIDEDAVRNTRDVDLLIRRDDLPAAKAGLEAAGFGNRRGLAPFAEAAEQKVPVPLSAGGSRTGLNNVLNVETFIDGPQGKPSGGIHILFATEKVRPHEEFPLPDIDQSERAVEFQVASLEALVLMKLASWRDKDRTHLRDMLGVGLLDATWPARLPSPLGARLQQLLDDPNG